MVLSVVGAKGVNRVAAKPVIFEACVTSVREAQMAVDGGADRAELCRDLEVGGLTPTVETFLAVRTTIDVPVFAMVRPRPGSFQIRPHGVEVMISQISSQSRAGPWTVWSREA